MASRKWELNSEPGYFGRGATAGASASPQLHAHTTHGSQPAFAIRENSGWGWSTTRNSSFLLRVFCFFLVGGILLRCAVDHRKLSLRPSGRAERIGIEPRVCRPSLQLLCRGGRAWARVFRKFVGVHQIDARQELVCRINPFRCSPGNIHKLRQACSGADVTAVVPSSSISSSRVRLADHDRRFPNSTPWRAK